jgi:hypothetical protein
MLTDAEIGRLIRVEKQITSPPKKRMSSRQGSLRNDFHLESLDGKEKFKAFIRVLEEFEEDFSVGLDHISSEGKSICLLRCNGRHGEHRNHRPGEVPFFDFHIHTATEEAFARGEEPEHFATRSTDYATWQDALRFFLSHIRVMNAQEHFPWLSQGNLFDER